MDDYEIAMILGFVILVLLVLSVILPVYGYKRWRKKGLAIGCIAQPLAILMLMLLSIALLTLFVDKPNMEKETAESMAIFRYSENGDCIVSQTWFLKADGKCLMEFEQSPAPESEAEYPCNMDHFYDNYEIQKLDSLTCDVGGRLRASFDIENQQVIALDRLDTLEVVCVDWEKVKNFFK